jgi:hypothetical protein
MRNILSAAAPLKRASMSGQQLMIFGKSGLAFLFEQFFELSEFQVRAIVLLFTLAKVIKRALLNVR